MKGNCQEITSLQPLNCSHTGIPRVVQRRVVKGTGGETVTMQEKEEEDRYDDS